MREFDYSKLASRTWDNEIISYVSQIHEYKGKQELFLRQKPVELERLIELPGSKVRKHPTVSRGLSRPGRA